MSSFAPVLLLLAVGCSAAATPALTSAAPPSVAPAGSAPPAVASAAAPMPSAITEPPPPPPPLQPVSVFDPVERSGARVPRTEPTTDVPPKGSVTLKGLTIRVTDIVVKRMNTGGEMLRATAHLSAGGKHVEQTFYSDETAFEWNGFLIEMRGGSNEAAGFAVVRAPRVSK